MKKIIFLLISAIPLCMHSPYLVQAWSSSRLDKLDWLFYLLSIPAAVWAVRKEKSGKEDHYALFLLLPMLFLTITTPFHQINAVGVASAVLMIFAAVWLLYSWQFAYRIIPAALILLLGTPSSSYQLSLLLMCPVAMAWAVKFLAVVLCFIWIYCNRRFGWLVKKGTFFFIAAVGCSCFLLVHTKEIYFEGESFIPEFPVHVGEFWGRRIQPDENTLRFFVTGKVEQYRYTGNDTDISVLAVRCGDDIHEIHPASHCLRTSQWTVISEKILYLQDNFAVTEIDAEKGSFRCLVWVWYSSEDFSTPGFLGFRRHFRKGGNYYTYQISIPVYDDDVEKSRDGLEKFIRLLKKERSDDTI